jgi:hypothetical protein
MADLKHMEATKPHSKEKKCRLKVHLPDWQKLNILYGEAI